MSGHSRWANIKHKKAKSDSKRGKLFSKLVKEVMVAAKLAGGDSSSNPRLRAAVEKAKGENVPADNIERAIKKGAGGLEGVNYEDGTYEGFGPAGVAVLVYYMTDNKNRTVPEVRQVFAKYGGRAGEVAWIFDKSGVFTFDINSMEEDKLMEAALSAGARDVITNKDDGVYEVYTDPSDFHRIKTSFDSMGFKYTMASVSMVPKTTVHVEGGDARKILKLMEELEDLDDIQEVYSNFDMPLEEMEKVA